MPNVIRITGVRDTLYAMQQFDPETKKALRKVIREALSETARGAKSEYPQGAWSVSVFNKYRGGQLALGSVKAAGGSRNNPWNTSDAGVRAAIFEFIGSSYGGNRPQVVNMIQSLTRRYGSPGRFLWDAWDSGGVRRLDDITREVKAAERRLQSLMDAAG